MDKLNTYKKDKLGMFILSLFLIGALLWIYPVCLKSVYSFIFLPQTCEEMTKSDFLDDLFIVVFSLPTIIPFCIFRIREFVCVLLDIKNKTQETIVVKSLKSPETVNFDRYIPEIKNKNDVYFYWKAISSSNKKYKFIIFKDVNTLNVETPKHFYSVTYFKNSKIVTSIDKNRV